MKIKNGTTRMVFLIGRYAIKIPQIKYHFGNFLNGLLSNMQEAKFSTIKDERMCPVLFCIRGGFLLIMPRCEPLSNDEFLKLDIKHFWGKETKLANGYYGDLVIPVEHKRDSFGWYKKNGVNNIIVAIDYGS